MSNWMVHFHCPSMASSLSQFAPAAKINAYPLLFLGIWITLLPVIHQPNPDGRLVVGVLKCSPIRKERGAGLVIPNLRTKKQRRPFDHIELIIQCKSVPLQ